MLSPELTEMRKRSATALAGTTWNALPQSADAAIEARIETCDTNPESEMARMSESLPIGRDRRKRQRFKINAPVTSFMGDSEIAAYTRDLSNRGVFFYLSQAESTQIDGEFEFMVDLPPEITLSTCCRIRCKARVVRTEESAMNFTGVAAEILEYSILRDVRSIA
jgi:PilZ domain